MIGTIVSIGAAVVVAVLVIWTGSTSTSVSEEGDDEPSEEDLTLR